jgi:ATP-dependent clp protease proteolytic subunit 2
VNADASGVDKEDVMTRIEKSFYDIEFDEATVLKNWGVNEVFYLKNLKDRKLFLTCDIDECIIDDIVSHILQYNADDKGKSVEERKPILLYCSSNGGNVDPGFELIDVIRQSKTPVYTINLGYQYSMGFLIGLAGHKRYGSKTAKYLMHDGSNFIYNSGAKAQDQMEFNKRIEARVKEYVLDRTKITSEMYDAQMRKEWYMFSDEAKELGVTDYIIGEDCDLDEII